MDESEMMTVTVCHLLSLYNVGLSLPRSVAISFLGNTLSWRTPRIRDNEM